MVTFWARVKNIIFKLKLLILKFGLLLEKLGHFLYQQLVTLTTTTTMMMPFKKC